MRSRTGDARSTWYAPWPLGTYLLCARPKPLWEVPVRALNPWASGASNNLVKVYHCRAPWDINGPRERVALASSGLPDGQRLRASGDSHLPKTSVGQTWPPRYRNDSITLLMAEMDKAPGSLCHRYGSIRCATGIILNGDEGFLLVLTE